MLKNKVAVITGGSRGIGKAIALQFAKDGANIAIIYAGNETSANQTVKEAEALGVTAKCYICNVADFKESNFIVLQILKDFGSIDILVNNAGITCDKLILQMKEDDFDNVIDINLKGAFNFIKHTYTHFIKKRQGRIINIASVSGITGNAGQANYASSKAGIIGLTKSVAKELASRNVTCNAIAPGFIKTDMTDAMPSQIKQRICEEVPLKRMGMPEEVGTLASFLASDFAAYITGEVIKIDGGLCI